MSQKSHHVVPNSDKGGWDVKKSGADRVSLHTDNKQDAIDRAREISQNQDTEMIVHNKDGRIAWRDSHGKDLYPPKG